MRKNQTLTQTVITCSRTEKVTETNLWQKYLACIHMYLFEKIAEILQAVEKNHLPQSK